MKKILTFTALSLCVLLTAEAQVSRVLKGIEYKAETAEVGSTGSVAPFWFSANQYGLSSTENVSGYLRAAVERKIENDSTNQWKFGYGVDAAAAYNFTSDIVIQQLYGEAQWWKLRLGVGSKQRQQELKNDALSMGGLTFSNNARPVPQVRGEFADWVNISRHARCVWFKGHMAYGMQTDGAWQRDFCGGSLSSNLYAKNVLYHSKAGYFKFGDEERFPLTFTFGLEMVSQFGGEVWNIKQRAGIEGEIDKCVKMGHGLRDFWDAFMPGGSDVNDGEQFANAAGNQLGSWNFSLDWNPGDWKARGYVDHFFEDHSQMFVQYGWKDMLAGLEFEFPKNPFVDGAVLEYLNMMDQSGPVYHDATAELPIQISGSDTYYNHHIYGAYQHWGQVMGNPLIISPIYNGSDIAQPLRVQNNRVRAYHVGLSGRPCEEVKWRVLFTHEKALGTYDIPNYDRPTGTYLLAEATYLPKQLKDWSFSLSYGSNNGGLLGESYGAMLKITKTGFITKQK